MKRGDFPRPRKMVNYSHMLVGALSLTSFILLVKYRNLTAQMSEDNMVHMMSQKALESDLESEIQRKKKSQEELSKIDKELKDTSSQLQKSQAELSNTAKALQLSYQQIEALKQENISKTEEVIRMSKENNKLQQEIKSLEDSLAVAEETIRKTKALADDNANTLKAFQEKHELLLSHNQQMGEKLGGALQELKLENENLKNQLKAALGKANLAKDKVTELQSVKLQSQGDQTKSVKDEDIGNTAQLNKQPEDDVKEEKAQVQDNNKQQEARGASSIKQSTSNARSIESTNTHKTASSKAASDSIKIKNVSEELKHYDMLEDDVKEQVKREMQATDGGDITDQELEDQEQVIDSPRESKNDQPPGDEVEADEEQKPEENQEEGDPEKNKEVNATENNDVEADDVDEQSSVVAANEESATSEKKLEELLKRTGSFDASPSEQSYSTEGNVKA